MREKSSIFRLLDMGRKLNALLPRESLYPLGDYANSLCKICGQREGIKNCI